MMKTIDKPFAVGRTAEVYAWENGQILKLYRDWCPANWVEIEARMGRMVNEAGVPSPRVGAVVEVNGRRGILYERVDGMEMLAMVGRSPLKLLECARTLAHLQVEMHRSGGGDLPLMRGNLEYSIRAAKGLPEDLRERALQKLAALPDGDRLCHGDFHPGNVILTSRGPVIIDWMTAARGNPAADVARTRLLLAVGDPPESGPKRWLILAGRSLFLRAYLRGYQQAAPEIVEQSQAYLPVIAAARINEDIAPEREKVLKMVRGE